MRGYDIINFGKVSVVCSHCLLQHQRVVCVYSKVHSFWKTTMKFLLIEMIHPPPSHHPLKSTTSQSQSQSESQMGSQRGRRWTGRGLAHVSSSSSPLSLWWCLSLTLLWLSRPCCTVTADASTAAAASSSNYFNFEVEKRILERLDFFLGGPVGVNEIIKNFRTNGGFPNDMWAADRDLYLSLAYAMPQPLVYFGLEDGTCSGYGLYHLLFYLFFCCCFSTLFCLVHAFY